MGVSWSGGLAERETLSLRLPATSANLGPGFDTLALALALSLEVEATRAAEFRIEASGRSAGVCSALKGNLLLETYRETWARYGTGAVQPLALTVRNGIPLGMGCGSSAASRLAGIALASHFGGLGWGRGRMLDEAAALEHHPDNAAACCLGGFVVAGWEGAAEDRLNRIERLERLDRLETATANPRPNRDANPDAIPVISRPRVRAVSIAPPAAWRALLVLPEQPLATTASRAVLPEQYGREAVVENLQNVALLTAAFARGDGQLLVDATRDRLHQPFRGLVCPLLPRLLPLAGSGGVLSVTLSGAGAGVLLLLEGEPVIAKAMEQVRSAAARAPALPIAELLPCALADAPAHLMPG